MGEGLLILAEHDNELGEGIKITMRHPHSIYRGACKVRR